MARIGVLAVPNSRFPAALLGRDDNSASRSFVDEQMAALAEQRDALESAIFETESALRDLQTGGINANQARAGLANFRRVYEQLRPFEKQDLFRLVLHRAVVGDHEITLEIYEEACASFAQASESDKRFEAPMWLPGEDSNLEHFG